MATDPLTLLNGTTADANEVEAKFAPLYNDLDPSNVTPARLVGPVTGNFVSDQSGQTTALQGNYTFAGTLTIIGAISFSSTVTFNSLVTFQGVATFNNTININGSATFSGINIFTTTIQARASIAIDLFTTGNRIDLDTDNDTSIRCSSDDNITIELGGVDRILINPSGELLLPNIDPPTANTTNRNSGVKAWLYATAGGVTNDAYNLSSIVKPGTGAYDVFFNTDFLSTNYVVVGTTTTLTNILNTSIQSAGDVLISTYDDDGISQDSIFHMIAIGDQ